MEQFKDKGYSMDKDIRKLNWKKLEENILFTAAIVQFLSICFINFTRSYQIQDYDSALAIRHAVEMWKNGLFLKNFDHTSTLEIDCAAFCAAPIYLLTGNLNFALGSIHVVIYGIFVWILNDLYKNLKLGLNALFLTLLAIFSPYSWGSLDWSNMIFLSAGQYEFRILLAIVLLDMVFVCRKKAWYRSAIGWFGGIMSFWVSLSGGNYALFLIIFPFILKMGYDIFQNQKLNLRDKRMHMLLFYAAVAFGGWKFRDAHVTAFMHQDMVLITAQDFWKNFQNCIVGIYLLFGAFSGDMAVSVFSYEGIARLIKWAFVSFCIAYVCYWARKNKDKNIRELLQCLAVSAFVNLGVLILVATTYGSSIFEYRYHLIWAVLMLICVSAVLESQMLEGENIWIKYAVRYGFVLALFAINVIGVYRLSTISSIGKSEQIKNYAEIYNADNIYLEELYTEAHVLRAVDLERYYGAFKAENGIMNIDTLDFYKYNPEDYQDDESSLLICSEETAAQIPVEILSQYERV